MNFKKGSKVRLKFPAFGEYEKPDKCYGNRIGIIRMIFEQRRATWNCIIKFENGNSFYGFWFKELELIKE